MWWIIFQFSCWIKHKKVATNPINKKDNKCFQYDATVALSYEEIGKHAKRISKINPFINKYKWEGTNFPSEKDDRKKNLNKKQTWISQKVCGNKDFCNVIMPCEHIKILKINQYPKFDKPPFVIHGYLKFLIEKIDGSKNNPKNSSTKKSKGTYSSGFFNVYDIFIWKNRK